MINTAQIIIDAGEAGLWLQAVSQLTEHLDARPGDIDAMKRLALIYRQTGELELAASLYTRVATLQPSDDEAQALVQVCRGRGGVHAGTIVPAPFIRRRNFLTDAERGKLLEYFAAHQGEMKQLGVTFTRVDKSVSTRYDTGLRHQFGFDCRSLLSQIFPPKMAKEHQRYCRALGIPSFRSGEHSLRLDYTPVGGFGQMHQDAGFDARVSYLYYFHDTPKQFSGGDLLLFDHDRERDKPVVDQFTRIRYEDNTLVVFSPLTYHQVTLVRSSEELPPDKSRLSVCGFIHPFGA